MKQLFSRKIAFDIFPLSSQDQISVLYLILSILITQMQQEAGSKQQIIRPFMPIQQVDFLQFSTEEEKYATYQEFLNIETQFDSHRFLHSLPNDIQYDQTLSFNKNVQLKTVKTSKNYQVIEIEAHLGYFKFKKISIINLQGVSPSHQLVHSDHGNFCTVYLCKYKNIPLAFKCFSKKKLAVPQDEGNILSKVIEEYCILKLASLMEVGPKMSPIFGFDIMIYPHCIQICMEACKPFPEDYMSIIDRVSFQLKENLIKMHSIQIVHHDIKVENLAFSQAFNRFVFIDFGMGRTLKQKLGFKSLTLFKGSLDHCSQQMAALYHQGSLTGKPVDLYFNDVNALKVTLQEILDEQYQEDIALISSQKKSHQMEHIDPIYLVQSAKYYLFRSNQRFFLELASLLSKQQLALLFCWTNNIKVSDQLRIIQLKLIQKARQKFGNFQENSSNYEEVQQKQSESLGMRTLCQINEANLHCKVAYFLNQFPRQISELYEFLKACEKLDIDSFNCLLAKAIQINGSDLALKQLQQLCQCACERNPQLYSLKGGLTKYSDASIKHFSLVSEYLFRKALAQKLRGKYFEVYLFIVNNVILYKIFKRQQLLLYYQSLFQMQLSFQKIITVLIRFHTALTWLYLTTFNFSQYKQLHVSIYQKRNILLPHLYTSFSKEQMHVLKTILLTNKMDSIQDVRIQQKYFVNQHNYVQANIYLICKKIEDAYCSRNLMQELENYIYQIQNISSSYFQYYHFYLILACIYQENIGKLQSWIRKCKRILRDKAQSPFLIIMQSACLYIKSKSKNIHKFISQISQLKNWQHPILNFRIQNLIHKYIVSQNEVFKKLSQYKKEQYCMLRLIFANRKMVICHSAQLQSRYLEQINQINRSVIAEIDYCRQIGRQCRLKKNIRQPYRRLRKLLQSIIQSKSKSIKQINLLLCLSNFLMIIMFIKDRKFQDAFKLAKYLYCITRFTNYKVFNTNTIFEYMFNYINERDGLNKITENKNLYFEYAKNIQEKHNEQLYLQRPLTFGQLLELMFEQCPHKLPSIINKTLRKTQIFNNKPIAQSLMLTFDMLFGKNYEKEHFVRECLALEDKIEASPYSCFLLFHIFRLKDFKKLTERDYLRVFLPLSRANIIVRERVLRNLLIFYLSFAKDRFSLRKRMGLSRKVIRYDWVAFTVKHLSKLLMSDQSRRRLKAAVHLRKHQTILQKLGRFLQCAQLSTTDHVEGTVVNRQIFCAKYVKKNE